MVVIRLFSPRLLVKDIASRKLLGSVVFTCLLMMDVNTFPFLLVCFFSYCTVGMGFRIIFLKDLFTFFGAHKRFFSFLFKDVKQLLQKGNIVILKLKF